MNETMRAHAVKLRSMPSFEAADWLLEHYPEGGDAIVLLEHVSLRRIDNQRLARRYLSGPTKASSRPYRVFAKLLGFSQLLRLLGEVEMRNAWDSDLLAYHLRSLLPEARDEEERRTVAALAEALILS